MKSKHDLLEKKYMIFQHT